METKKLTSWDNPFISGADIVRGSRTVRIPTGNDLRSIQSDRVRRPGKGNPHKLKVLQKNLYCMKI